MNRTSSHILSALIGASALALVLVAAGAQTAQKYCVPSLADQAVPGACVQASSAPTFGTLYPLGPELNIDAFGRVGMGTLAPTERLAVDGTVQSLSGGFRFPDGSLQSTATKGNGATLVNELSGVSNGSIPDIALSEGKQYMIHLALVQLAIQPASLQLRLNGGAPGHFFRLRRLALTTVSQDDDTMAGHILATEIPLGSMNSASSGGLLRGTLSISTHPVGPNTALISGNYIAVDGYPDTGYVAYRLHGAFHENSPRSLTIEDVNDSAMFSYSIRVYEVHSD